MWSLSTVTQILSTIYERVRIKYHILKSPDGVALQIRNYSDSDYSDIDVKGLRFSGAVATLTEFIVVWGNQGDPFIGSGLSGSGVNTSQNHNILQQRSAPANGDKTRWRIPLMAPGAYRANFFHASASTGGIADIRIEDASENLIVTAISATDMYTAGTTFNKLATADFTLPAYSADELYLTMLITGKNASSSGFASFISFVELVMLGY